MPRVDSLERLLPTPEHAFVESIDYAAVPLDLPVDDIRYCPYVVASLDRINGRLDDAMHDARLHGWVASGDLASQLKLLIQESLLTSHWERIDRNRKSDISAFADMNDERVIRAHEGVARPLELISILEDYPRIKTIELAKLSHPLDNEAADAMDSEVKQAIQFLGEELLPGEPRYKRKLSRDDIPAAIILRKQAISDYETVHGRIQIISRRAFLTRGDAEAQVIPFLDRKIRNPDRIDELGQKIEAYLPGLHEDLRWLQPIATSYYAKYLTEDRKVEDIS